MDTRTFTAEPGQAVLKIFELAIQVIIVSVFYGTDTCFGGCMVSFPDGNKIGTEASNNFGQFVIIGGLISTVILVVLSLTLSLPKKMPKLVAIYNLVWVILYFVAAVVILSMWSHVVPLGHAGSKMQQGGRTVGSFCLFEVVLLIISSCIYFSAASSTSGLIMPHT